MTAISTTNSSFSSTFSSFSTSSSIPPTSSDVVTVDFTTFRQRFLDQIYYHMKHDKYSLKFDSFPVSSELFHSLSPLKRTKKVKRKFPWHSMKIVANGRKSLYKGPKLKSLFRDLKEDWTRFELSTKHNDTFKYEITSLDLQYFEDHKHW